MEDLAFRTSPWKSYARTRPPYARPPPPPRPFFGHEAISGGEGGGVYILTPGFYMTPPSFILRDGETTIKIKFALLGGGALGAQREILRKHRFSWERHDNKILKLQILLLKSSVVIAQAPMYNHPHYLGGYF